MKFHLRRTSELLVEEESKTIEINTLEDLQALQRENGYQLIVNFYQETWFPEHYPIDGADGSIEVYDSWRE